MLIDPRRAECDACPVSVLVALAYGLRYPYPQMQSLQRWMTFDLYNFEVASTAPVSRTQMSHVLFRSVLERCFSLRVREVTKAVPGFALVVAPGGIKFSALNRKPSADPPNEGIVHLPTLQNLADALTADYYSGKRMGVTRPVRDATGLDGFYSIPFPFGPQPGINLLAWIGRLGLRVIPDPEPATDTRLQILHLDHLSTNCALGPHAP